MKSFSKVLCMGIITTISISAYAGTYNKEIVLGHKDAWNSDTIGLTGTYYFGEVDDSLGPLAEASFLSPQSSVGAWTSQRTRENAPNTEKRDQSGAFGTWHSGNGLYLSAGYNKREEKIRQPSGTVTPDGTRQWTTGTLGYYINDTTTAWVGYREWKNTTVGSSYKQTRQNVGIKHLMTLGDSHLALQAEQFQATDNDNWDYTELETKATYYPANNIGFSVGMLDTNYKDDLAHPGWDNTEYSLGTEYFISPTMSLGMTMNRTEWSGGNSGRSQQVALTSRF